jgi:acyl carrier protein
MADIEERARKLVSDHLGVDADKVNRDARLVDDLGADSLDIVELVMGAEEEFGHEISDEEAERISTFGDVVDLLQSKAD